ncbi:MAG TPA: anthrone oxygenase family protein [Acidimicrobiales bacterium]|nr:anthrone oxygenase family protein [Acidimicrobiales bacterium]
MIVAPNLTAPAPDTRSVAPTGPLPRRTAGRVLGASLVATGLMAGFFYAWAVSVMLGLAKTDDRTFVLSMQRINEAVQNAAFLPVFFGAFVLPAVAAMLHRRLGLRDATRWIVAAVALYGVALAVTFGINIPLNDQLDRAGDPDLITNLAAVRNDFEGPWVAWNVVRALLSTAALGCLGRALVLHGGSTRRS